MNGIPYKIHPAWASDSPDVEGAINVRPNVESDMANSVPNDSPVVKLAISLLDDAHGVKEETLQALTDVVAHVYGPRAFPAYDRILKAVEGSDGRVYLPEGWNEE